MAKGLGIVIGLIFLVIPIYIWIVNLWDMGAAALTFLKGGIIWLLLLIGVISVLVGIADLKE